MIFRGSKIFKIYPGMIEMKYKRNKQVIPGHIQGLQVAKGKIKGFSKKSRLNMIKYLCRIENDPQVLWHPTFPDDVFHEKTIDQKREYSSRVLHNLRKFIRNQKIDIQIIWKREWMPRQSGSIVGEVCPHFHMALYSSQGSDYIYEQLGKLIARFIKLSGSKDIHNMSAVNFDKKSYQTITEDDWREYQTKYQSKVAEIENENIGRSWGVIGKFKLSLGKEILLSTVQSKALKRLMRQYMSRRQINRRVKSRMSIYMKREAWEGFVMMRKTTMKKLIDFVQKNY